MSDPWRPLPRTRKWFAADAGRNEAAIRERLRTDGRKPPGQNLEEGIPLIELGFELLGAASRHVDD